MRRLAWALGIAALAAGPVRAGLDLACAGCPRDLLTLVPASVGALALGGVALRRAEAALVVGLLALPLAAYVFPDPLLLLAAGLAVGSGIAGKASPPQPA